MRRAFLLLAALGIAATTPAAGQAPVTVSTDRAAPAAAPIPDSLRHLVASVSHRLRDSVLGPGPVSNRSRSRNGVANFQQLVGDYTNPILQPWAADVVKKHGEMSLTGIGYPTPSNQCWPGGVPYVFWDFLLQMVQQPDRITWCTGKAMRCAGCA